MKNVLAVLLVSLWGIFVLPTRAPAEIPCDNYFGQGINHGHYMPTSDGTIGHYNALASQDGFAYAIVKGSISGSPVLLRCLELGSNLYQMPIIRSFVSLPGSSNNIILMAGYAYLPLGSLGIGIIDISNPDLLTAPVYTPTFDTCRDVAALGAGHLVTAEWSSLKIYDLTDPAAPVPISAVPLSQARTVALAGDHAFVACGVLGLAVVNIAEVGDPYLVGQFSVGGFVDQLVAEGSRVYLTGYLLDLVTVDVTDPSSPQVLDTLPLAGEPEAIEIRGGYAYVIAGEAVPVFPGGPEYDAMALVRLNPEGFPLVEEYFFTTENYSCLALGDDLVLLGETEATSELILAPLRCPDVSDVPDSFPLSVSLAEPFPNPFNPRVNVRFKLPAGMSGQLAVYDLRGSLVAEVWTGVGTDRDQKATWNGVDKNGQACPSGTYHFRLTGLSGGPVDSARATLLR